MGELPTDLGQLRRDDHLAIRLPDVPSVIVQVVGLGGEKAGQRGHLGHEGIRPDAIGLETLHDRACHPLLLLILVEDDRPVLGPHIGPLAIPCGGIVHREEHLEERVQGEYVRVEAHPHHLRVARAPRADRLVGGGRVVPTGVSRLDALDTVQLQEGGLGTPEAPTAEGHVFGLSHGRSIPLHGLRRGRVGVQRLGDHVPGSVQELELEPLVERRPGSILGPGLPVR